MLRCASLLRTIFASLARANERVHLHNERNFPQTKLDSEIFLWLNNGVHVILFNLKILFNTKLSEGKKM